MVVPARVAAQFGGAVAPMVAKAFPNGIHGALVGSSGITAQAAFVPFAGVGACIVATPLITFAVAAALDARAEVGLIVNEPASRISTVRRQLSRLQLDRPHGLRDLVFSAGEVDDLLRLSCELRDVGDIDVAQIPADIAVDMVRASDGSVFVLPALTDTV